MPSSSAILATISVGMEPRQVTIAPDGKRAYVSLSDPSPSPPQGAIGVIDTRSNTLVATVAVGILPGGVVVAPDGRHAYVPNIQHGGVVSVIETATNAVVDNITVSVPTSRPLEAAITPDGRELYVAINDASPSDQRGAVTVVDTEQRAVTANVVLTPCEDPAATVITPDGRFVWVLNIGLEGDGPAVFDTTTHEMTFPLRTGIACGRMAFTPDGAFVYLFSDSADFGEVFEVASRKLVTAFDTFGGNTTDVAVTPDGRHVYVTQRPGKAAGGRALVIDTTTQKRVDPPIELPRSADGLAFMPDGRTAYVSDRPSREVHVIAVRS
jgi:YVTN family beta-propeller protein